jgi:hypothetical protein
VFSPGDLAAATTLVNRVLAAFADERGGQPSFGEFLEILGGAGSQDGPQRLISEEEAAAVGLLDGTYRQTYVSVYFQKSLNEGRFDNGPVPGDFR